MSPIPENLGKTLAQFQDLVDRGVEWGAKKLDEIDDAPQKKEDQYKNETLQKASGYGKGFLKGIGRMGKSYYSEYERLKNEKEKKQANGVQCHKDSIFFKTHEISKNVHPVVVEVPHGGTHIPEFMRPYIREVESIQKDADWFTQEVYGELCPTVHKYLQWNIARVLVDPNRNLEDHLEYIKPDGVIKAKSMFSTDVWKIDPPLDLLNQFLDSCVRPYYDILEKSISDSQTEFVLFGHSMPEQNTVSSTAIDSDKSKKRPLFSISNGHNHAVGISETKLDELSEYFADSLSQFNLENIEYDLISPVKTNYPYGGTVSIERFNTSQYGNAKAVLIEFNRGMGNNPENIEILKKVMKGVLEVLMRK